MIPRKTLLLLLFVSLVSIQNPLAAYVPSVEPENKNLISGWPTPIGWKLLPQYRIDEQQG